VLQNQLEEVKVAQTFLQWLSKSTRCQLKALSLAPSSSDKALCLSKED
jgi:hypothetical protein